MDDEEKNPPVIPHLTVSDAAGAIAFYIRAFGATIRGRVTAEDGRRIVNASLELNGGLVVVTDDFPEHNDGRSRAPSECDPSNVTIHLDVADVNAAQIRAEAAGATISMPAADMVWGQRYARLRDPFGHEWSLGGPLSDP